MAESSDTEPLNTFYVDFQKSFKEVIEHEKALQAQRQEELTNELNDKWEIILAAKNEELQSTRDDLREANEVIDKQKKIMATILGNRRAHLLKKKYFGAFKDYHNGLKHRGQMGDFCDNFFARGTLRKTLCAWKRYSHMSGKDLIDQKWERRVRNDVDKHKKKISSESDMLRALLEKTQDELTIERETTAFLRQKYDQALIKGIQALSHETMNITNTNLTEYHKEVRESFQARSLEQSRYSPTRSQGL